MIGQTIFVDSFETEMTLDGLPVMTRSNMHSKCVFVFARFRTLGTSQILNYTVNERNVTFQSCV